ncbi:hypothetical protein BD289DRAFT_378498 [Coniella lustricola]|uniref:DUF1772-domain-containing protein n=1 Tax=Coniella lustricola TaxID=2025994 RepID=A0A2T2ZTY4_9PEZI|nr:hypothetical protein BD289DRAFT_378498 [Coniella lustricola]
MADYQSNPLRTTAALVGLSSTLVLAGVNIGTSALFIPHLLSSSSSGSSSSSPLPIETTTAIFTRLYRDGAKLVVPLAAAGTLSFGLLAAEFSSFRGGPVARGTLSSSLMDSTPRILLATASALVVSTLAWTGIVVMPVNNRLVSIAESSAKTDRGSSSKQREEVDSLLRSWQWMNYVRGFGALAAGIVALGALVV